MVILVGGVCQPPNLLPNLFGREGKITVLSLEWATLEADFSIKDLDEQVPISVVVEFFFHVSFVNFTLEKDVGEHFEEISSQKIHLRRHRSFPPPPTAF